MQALYVGRDVTIGSRVYTFFYRPHEVYSRKSYFLDNSANKHPDLTNLGIYLIYSYIYRFKDCDKVVSAVISVIILS